jgi:hypothetical protein
MMKGHALEDFSAIYEYLAGDDDFSTVNQKLVDSPGTPI